MNRENNYKIVINFDDNEKKLILKHNIQYIGSKSYTDVIKISSNQIIINAFRSSKIDLESVFYNHNSSLYNQIIKVLIYYYASIKKYVEINEIIIERSRKEKLFETKTVKKDKLRKILSVDFSMDFEITKDKLKTIFNEDEKGKTLFIATSYLLKANSLEEAGDKFDRLWRAFNSIYKIVGGKNKEFDNLKELKSFLLSNHVCLKNSLQTTQNIDSEKLRNKLRWRALILNDYDNEKKTKAFKEFAIRYNDKRIMSVLKETLPYREDFLKKHKFYSTVLNHINSNINKNTINNAEIISIICIKYLYFIRNKSFHGEKLDYSFRLARNKETNEIEWTNKILESLIVDLINCNDKY